MFKSMTVIKPVCEEIRSQQPQLSETMAVACALLAMTEFREKVKAAQPQQPNLQSIVNVQRTYGICKVA